MNLLIFQSSRSKTFYVVNPMNLHLTVTQGHPDIDAVGAWVRARGGALGGFGELPGFGRYREGFISDADPFTVNFRRMHSNV